MEENEKKIIAKMSTVIPKLDKEKQSYILGVAEGMALMAQSRREAKEKESEGD